MIKNLHSQVLANLTRGTAQVLPEGELAAKLQRKKNLIVKLGADPTAPDLHLGHAIVLEKLRHFQEAGHTIVFLIGDFTARIGDPSGKSKTRPPLSEEIIKKNAETYLAQVGKIVDPNKVQIRYNSEWLQPLDFAAWLKIAGKVTLARIIERDDFSKRLQEQTAIGFHELFYPLMQAYDSVALKADVELGGTDQTFNLLMGRYLQECMGHDPQVIMTLPLLEGLDGQQKMSKSLGNHIGLIEPADQAFGKLMSLPDLLMWRYYELLLHASLTSIQEMQLALADGSAHPMELKKDLAAKIITKFWSQDEAEAARKQFESIFQKHDYSQANEFSLPSDMPATVWIVDLLKKLGAITSTSEGKRLIESGAISIDDVKVTDFHYNVTWKQGMIVKAGKHRIYKLR